MPKRTPSRRQEREADADSVASRLMVVRGRRVILDADLADLYGVPTKRLNEQVKRNPDRFPVDFVFSLSALEKAEVVANCDHLARLKFSPSLPYAFTEHGAIMAANVLNSGRAIEMSVYVVRAFVKMRETLAATADLARRLDAVERKIGDHDDAIRALVATVRQLMSPPAAPRRRIGFTKQDE